MYRAIAAVSTAIMTPIMLGTRIVANWMDQTDPSEITTGQKAILLIHGSGASDLEFSYAKSILNQKYNGSVFGIQYDGIWMRDNQASIKDFAQKVKERCDDIVSKTEQNEIILIGVSMGGLIGSYYKENLAPETVKVSQVITVGSPWNGAPGLNIVPLEYFSTRYVEMKPDSDFLVELKEKACEKIADYIFIGSEEDLMVPYSASYIEVPGVATIKYRGLGHTSLHTAPSVWNEISDLI